MMKRLILIPIIILNKLYKFLLFKNLLFSHKVGGVSSIPLPIIDDKRKDKNKKKGLNSYKKLDLILKNIPKDAKNIIDVGSNNGFFSIKLAQKGYQVIGYEPTDKFVESSNMICRKYDINNAVFYKIGLDKDSSESLFDADISLVLSVLHNWVKQSDYNTAIEILKNIWSKTNKIMFFELADTIDNEYIASFDTMPSMGNTTSECTIFMKNKMLAQLTNAKVEFLELMPTDYNNGTARHLFKISRIK